jgi:hypothetical protein
MLPGAEAWNVSFQGVAGAGGAQRRPPTGAAAYGIPRYDVTPLPVTPQIGPLSILTVVPGAHPAAAPNDAGRAPDAAELDDVQGATHTISTAAAHTDTATFAELALALMLTPPSRSQTVREHPDSTALSRSTLLVPARNAL